MISLSNRLIFKKFRVKKLIKNSSISKVYEGINELTKERVAMKFEKIGGKYDLLESEAYFLLLLKGFGIPRLISFGKITYYKILVEELLGPCIYLTWDISNQKKRLNDICLVAIQCLDRLEYIHSKDVIHQDIKPFNFIFGRNDPNVIYLIDFGLSKKYRSSRTGKHIKFKFLNKINGSFRYMSINCNKGYEQSRRDDLESLGYMLVFLAKKKLPWPDIDINKKENKILQSKKILAKKIETTPEQLCSGLPFEFVEYIKYCKSLEFEDDPNYNYLKNLFITILKKNQNIIDERSIGFIQFSWLKKKKSRSSSNNNTHNISFSKYSDSKKRKTSIHKRLYKRIKNSLDRAKSQELPKVRNSKFFKFNANNIYRILNKYNTNNKKKFEIVRTNNITLLKTKTKIIENNNNKINKFNINKKNRTKTSSSELEKKEHITNPKKKNTYTKKIINNLPEKINDKNFYKSILEKRKIFEHIMNQESITNLNKSEDNNFDSYCNDQQSFRYYKTLRERNEMKEDRKKIYIPILNNSIESSNFGNQEKNTFPFNRNTFQQINRYIDYKSIFNSSIIPLRNQTELFH